MNTFAIPADCFSAVIASQAVLYHSRPRSEDRPFKFVVLSDDETDHGQHVGELVGFHKSARLQRRHEHRESLSLRADKGPLYP